MQHKFNVGDTVIHNGKKGPERAIVVGICLATEWDTEARYAVELMDRVTIVEAYSGMRQKDLRFKIVNEATERSLTYCEPEEQEEEEVADIVDSIDNEVLPSGV